MKKIMMTMLLLLAGLAVSAQVETFRKITRKGDPMLGTQDATIWDSMHSRIAENADGTCSICLDCKNHVFVEGKFRVGFYDDAGNLISMCDSWYFRTSSDATTAFLVENGFSNDSIPGSKNIGNGKYMVPCKAILEYLKKGKGHVRFVTTTYGDYIYDVSVAAIKEQ